MVHSEATRKIRCLLSVISIPICGVFFLCKGIASVVLMAWNAADTSPATDQGLDETESRMRDLDPYFEEGGYYRYDRE